MRTSLLAAICVSIAICLLQAPERAAAQQATVQPIGHLEGDRSSTCTAISADGNVVIGYSSDGYFGRDYIWRASTGIEELNIPGGGTPNDLSGDGSVVVGYRENPSTYAYEAFRWSQADGREVLSGLGPTGTDSHAFWVSPDGNVVVGRSRDGDASKACRWTSPSAVENLGVLGKESFAEAASADGTVVVGSAQWDLDYNRAFRWTQATGIVDLGAFGTSPDRYSWASDVSADGSVVVGESGDYASFGSARAFRWTQATGMVDITPAGSFNGTATAISADGRVIVGSIDFEPCVWIDGAFHYLSDLMPNAEWTVFEAVDVSADGTKIGAAVYNDSKPYGVAAVITLSDEQPNQPPTIAAIAPVTRECIDGQHTVQLSAAVNDPDGQPLTVTWKVDGQVQKTENVTSGAVAAFAFAYGHGVHSVEATVSDGAAQASTATTVTVQDTAAPIVIIASDVVVSTDPGKAFATNVSLPQPTASDASGHPVTLSVNAPGTYPVGTTDVLWTATDEAGNVGTATQKVIVQDREKPKIVPLPPIRKFCDPGKLVATVALVKPKAIDNVPGVHVTTKAGKTFKIGTTNVVWTAKDAAGNTANWTQKVIVTNRAPKANAGPDRTITTASEKGVRVVLDGSKSSDPDKHKLKYAWTAKKVKFSNGTTAKPSGIFPVGTTVVTLTVTDAGGLKRTDTVRVTVKLKNGKRRPRGSDANRSFAAATRQASQVVAEKGSRSGAALSGLAYANAASAYGDAAGECVLWEEGQSEADATLAYAELRSVQRTYGQAAANALLSAYAETGDEGLLSAYGYAAYGSAYAASDLSEQ